jgi:membrane protein implicated in regulation of membrane protease activity
MESHSIWLIIGIVLVVAERMTGTFSLLFLGMAALVGCGFSGQQRCPSEVRAAGISEVVFVSRGDGV